MGDLSGTEWSPMLSIQQQRFLHRHSNSLGGSLTFLEMANSKN